MLPQQELRRAAAVPLFLFAVIIFTRQLGDRPWCFDVTVSLVVLWAAAWSALIPTTVQCLKLVKQELAKAIVYPIIGPVLLHPGCERTLILLKHSMSAFMVRTFKHKSASSWQIQTKTHTSQFSIITIKSEAWTVHDIWCKSVSIKRGWTQKTNRSQFDWVSEDSHCAVMGSVWTHSLSLCIKTK